jgi:transcriptional regulator with XRE-family HTH domain
MPQRYSDKNTIRDARIRHRLSLAELSAKTGYSRTYLSKIELGQLKPSHEAVLILAEALRLETSRLEYAYGFVPKIISKWLFNTMKNFHTIIKLVQIEESNAKK